MTPNELLREAAEYIAEHDWTQGRAYDDGSNGWAIPSWKSVEEMQEWVQRTTPAACAVGAIRAAASIHGLRGNAWNNAVIRAEDLLRQRLDIPYSIPEWNDRPERTAEDVILAMKRAAEL